MRDFMPCKGCDEPEACEIEGRCLEPAPGPLRLLTPAEHFQIGLKEPVRIADIEAIQRKFCEVNGLTLGVPGTTPNPCKLTECQGKPRCEKCVAMGLNDPRGAAGMTLATDANDEDPHVIATLRETGHQPEHVREVLRELLDAPGVAPSAEALLRELVEALDAMEDHLFTMEKLDRITAARRAARAHVSGVKEVGRG